MFGNLLSNTLNRFDLLDSLDHILYINPFSDGGLQVLEDEALIPRSHNNHPSHDKALSLHVARNQNLPEFGYQGQREEGAETSRPACRIVEVLLQGE